MQPSKIAMLLDGLGSCATIADVADVPVAVAPTVDPKSVKRLTQELESTRAVARERRGKSRSSKT